MTLSRPQQAQFLLRFDDLSPGMNRDRWERFSPLLERFHIRPILAVIPDNRDPELEDAAFSHAPSDVQRLQVAQFWDDMQKLEKNGSSIALHGYQHLCRAHGKSLIPLHGSSEFAGAKQQQQREWIQAGIEILRANGLEPKLWVAPRHGFDATTLKILAQAGIRIVSDGFSTKPFRWHDLLWFPQQLWAPSVKQSGLWTICIHPATASDIQVQELETFVARYQNQFTSVERVLNEWPILDRSLCDRLAHHQSLFRLRCSRSKRDLIRLLSPHHL